MSILHLSKDCLYHVMTYLASPVDRSNLVLAINTGIAQLALEEPSLWRKWQNLNVTDCLFLRYPKMITMVLDNVAKIDKISLSLITEQNLCSLDEIIDGIEESEKEVWEAKELEVDVQDSANTELGTVVRLLSVVLKKLGKSVVTLKCHVNERPSLGPSVVATLFRCIMESDKFQTTTVFDLKGFDTNVHLGLSLKEIVNRMPIKNLKISGLNRLLRSCLNGTMENLEELVVVDCDSIVADVLLSIYDGIGFPSMKKVAFTCANLHDAVKWNNVCGRCFSHCSSDLVLTRPPGVLEVGDLNWEETFQWFQMRGLVQSFIEMQISQETSEGVTHRLTLGQRIFPGLFCFEIKELSRWMQQYNFEKQKSSHSVKYRVKQNSEIILICMDKMD